jgi:hypothetical protein
MWLSARSRWNLPIAEMMAEKLMCKMGPGGKLILDYNLQKLRYYISQYV